MRCKLFSLHGILQSRWTWKPFGRINNENNRKRYILKLVDLAFVCKLVLLVIFSISETYEGFANHYVNLQFQNSNLRMLFFNMKIILKCYHIKLNCFFEIEPIIQISLSGSVFWHFSNMREIHLEILFLQKSNKNVFLLLLFCC